jgi:hypothetical protein
MAVRVQPGSAIIKLLRRPIVHRPSVDGTTVSYTASPIRATGEVTLLGDPGDSAIGWTLGFVQLRWIETNWCFYRGKTYYDGSIFIQRPPDRPGRGCCDCVEGSNPSRMFYSTIPSHGEIALGAGNSFPLKLAVTHFNQPFDSVNLVELNAHPGLSSVRPNFITESQTEFYFCTVLSVREPGGAFHHLKAFYWNVHWETTFKVTNFTDPADGLEIYVIRTGSHANVGRMTDGEPIDGRFRSLLHSVPTTSCNQVTQTEVSEWNRHEAPIWKNFDVRRA